MGVTLTSTIDLVQATTVGQSILPIREGHIDYDSS